MAEGWIKLHRKLIDWEWYTDIPVKVLFLHLVLSANHVDKKWRGNDIKRGQLLTGRVKLAEDTGLSQQQVRTALDKLVSTGEVTTKATNSFSTVTICNYNDYQLKEMTANQQPNQPSTSDQPTDNQRVTTTKNENKVKKFIAPSQKEVDDYCLERSNGVNSIKWMNHYTANGWMVGRNKMKSWKAAVRTWEESAPKANAIQSVGDM